MAASITVSDLTWSTPEGRSIFSGLGLTFGPERTGLVGRNGVGKSTLLKLIAGGLRPQAGSVAVGGRLAVLRQTVQVEAGRTVADLFGVTDALALLRRAEAGDASPDELDVTDWTLESRVTSALHRLGLVVPPETPLAALSGGQLTRAGLAALVFSEPDVLLLDEPTNNLDRDGRAAVTDLLAGWRAAAVVVSHDRDLLDAVDAIVELTPAGATRYGGNWSAYRVQKAVELGAAERVLADAEKRVATADRAAQDRAERQSRRTKAGRRDGLKGGTPRILLGGRKDRAEDTAGGHARLAERHRERALADATSARERVEVLKPLSINLSPTRLPAGKVVLKFDAVTAGYHPGRPVLRDLSLTLTGPERVAVTGANGSGKTTLLALATRRLRPWAGAAQVMTGFVVLDQQVTLLDPSASVFDNFRRINTPGDEPACRSALAKFRFRADAALQRVSTLSGGQVLRAGLACVLGGPAPPPLLVLDEPTNHLDVDSVEAVEAGLRAYDGALLVVSHDEAFLRAVGISRRIEL